MAERPSMRDALGPSLALRGDREQIDRLKRALLTDPPRGPGRPPRDQLQLVAEVAALRRADPPPSASACARLLRARKEDVLRAVQLLEAAESRFPYSRSGIRGGGL